MTDDNDHSGKGWFFSDKGKKKPGDEMAGLNEFLIPVR